MKKVTKKSSEIVRFSRVVLVMDRSGSMQSVVTETIKGVNQVIKTCKNVASELDNLDVRFTLVGFDSNGYGSRGSSSIEILMDDVPMSKIQYVTNKEIFGRGGTPLYESIGFTIDHVKKMTDENVLFITFTDGDNTDTCQRYIQSTVAAMVERQDKWTFALVAANQDEKLVASSLNMKHAMKYQSTSAGTRSAFYQLSKSIRKYLEGKSQDAGYLPAEFFEVVDEAQARMTVNELSCTVNMPEALKDEDEKTDELPPYAPVPAYVVDEYPACPTDWMHGSTKASSYFVPVQTGQGMWLDFNKCSEYSHDVAIVISVQGINPVTGLKTSELRLEKFANKCPVHDVDFQQDRFCPECKYKWPAQNYISSSATPNGQLWIDGFLTPEGEVKQYVFTKPEEMRGVAQSIIGKDAVYAIGVAFYRLKEKKPQPRSFLRDFEDTSYRGRGMVYGSSLKCLSSYKSICKGGNVRSASASSAPSACETSDFGPIDAPVAASSTSPMFFSPTHSPENWKVSNQDKLIDSEIPTSASLRSALTDLDAVADSDEVFIDSETGLNDLCMESCMADDENEPAKEPVLYSCDDIKVVQAVKMDVAAGESIKQRIADDTHSLDEYEAEPIGMIYVNYTDKNTVEKILAAGKRKEQKSGFLQKAKVGNK